MTYNGLNKVIASLLKEFNNSEVDFVLTWNNKNNNTLHTMTNLKPSDEITKAVEGIQKLLNEKNKPLPEWDL